MRVRVRLTGFGAFHGVQHNPTTILAGELAALIEDSPLRGLVVIEDARVLEVSGLACARYLKDNATVVEEERAADSSAEPLLFLHLGVAASRKVICLESTAYNCANFGVADERGWMPQQQLIEEAAGAPPHRCSRIALDTICAALQAESLPVQMSTDPGRFICNYIYYRSLAQAGERCESLFVHVPEFAAVPKEVQLVCIVSLLAKIRDALIK